jgi:antitoxin PrlF
MVYRTVMIPIASIYSSVDEFLALLAGDLAVRPEVIRPVSPDLAARIAALTLGAPDDPAGAIDGIVAL